MAREKKIKIFQDQVMQMPNIEKDWNIQGLIECNSNSHLLRLNIYEKSKKLRFRIHPCFAFILGFQPNQLLVSNLTVFPNTLVGGIKVATIDNKHKYSPNVSKYGYYCLDTLDQYQKIADGVGSENMNRWLFASQITFTNSRISFRIPIIEKL